MRWLSEPDQGMYDAINKGMRLATGEILAYLNSDDLYFPWTLEAVVDGLRAADPDADLVYGGRVCSRVTSTGVAAGISLPAGRRRQGLSVSGRLPGTAAGLLATASLDEVGPFDDSLRYVADCDYWMRAGERHTFSR